MCAVTELQRNTTEVRGRRSKAQTAGMGTVPTTEPVINTQETHIVFSHHIIDLVGITRLRLLCVSGSSK